MSLGKYKKTRGNALFARDELEALFDVGSDADMENEEEEDEGTSSLTHVGPSDSTSSGTVVSRTGPVRDPWMPTPSEIQSRFGSTAPPSQYALYSCSGSKYDDVTKELDFDPATDQRRDYCIGLFHDLRWYGNKKTSRRSRVPEWQTLLQSWGAFVDNFNSNPAGYRECLRLARKQYGHYFKRSKIERLH
ncbi:unnamed protein product [Phytophthora fragariaefolia]|uniref:Unnamed protein product n=1 Tax=Phytophthora fragariaefolia TaxID=1490495 RepID=A0A9W6XJC9_9STRA|nr:unnamed protein product [Phytophthora fragariaefolia]